MSNIMPIKEITGLIKDISDFPKPGILFKDITPILDDSKAFKSLTQHFAEAIDPATTRLLAVESRGFILGAAVAQLLDVGMILVRKPGKLPRETFSYTYDLEYGSDTLEIHKDDITPNDKVTVIDDVLATGGTAQAVEELCKLSGATLLGHCFLMEISALKGHEKLHAPTKAFIQV